MARNAVNDSWRNVVPAASPAACTATTTCASVHTSRYRCALCSCREHWFASVILRMPSWRSTCGRGGNNAHMSEALAPKTLPCCER